VTFLDLWLPAELSTAWALGLTVLSFFTSAFTAAFGIGGGGALITMMLLILPPTIVLPLHGVVQTGSNAGRAYAMRASVRWPLVGWFALGSVLGIAAATMVFVALPQRLLLGLLASFILWSLWMPGLSKRAIADRSFVGVGAFASFATMFVGATGPLVAAFWRVEALGRQGVVACHGAVMTIQHGLKVVAFGWLGFAYGQWLLLIVAMIVSGYAGTLLGKHLLSRLPEKQFATIFKWTLTVLALRLAWGALAGTD